MSHPLPISTLMRSIRLNGGITFNCVSDQRIEQGYAVSVDKTRERRIPTDTLTDAHIGGYVRDNDSVLGTGELCLGVWSNPEDGQTYLDCVRVCATPSQAQFYAQLNDQLAFYDLAAQETIWVGVPA